LVNHGICHSHSQRAHAPFRQDQLIKYELKRRGSVGRREGRRFTYSAIMVIPGVIKATEYLFSSYSCQQIGSREKEGRERVISKKRGNSKEKRRLR